MAALIGHQRPAIETLLPEQADGDGVICWPERIGPDSKFFDGKQPLYFLGVSRGHSLGGHERKERVAVFGNSPTTAPRPLTELGGCQFAVVVREATPKEARSAGVEAGVGETVELLQFNVFVGGTIVRFVPTGKIATYARV